MISLADLLGFQSQFAPTPSNAASNMPIGPPWPGPLTSSLRPANGFPGETEQAGRMNSGGAFAGDSGANWPALLPRLDALATQSPPQPPGGRIPFNLLDLVAAAWAPPNLPLFPGAPAPTGAPVAASAPAAGAPSSLRPLHEIQQAALPRNPYEPASGGDTAASPWTSSDWSAAPRISAAAPPYADRAASNPYVGSAAGVGELDPARTRRLLAEAKRAYDFAALISGGPSVRSALPMADAATATDAPRSGASSPGSDDQFGRAVGLQPPQNQLGPAVPPMVLAANEQAPARPGWRPVPPLADFAPYSPENRQRGSATYEVIKDALDALGVYLRRGRSAIGGDNDYNRCMRAANGDAEQWIEFCNNMPFGLRGNVAGNDSAWRECREKTYKSKQMKENWCRNQFGSE